ncbi:unnamed protein product [Durusdinium trenchii]|uniref:Metalloendopeptidase n=2 Tax=Durusdinium trenchii TaxID=1381693 RepID=A0ABP0SPP4_9DINO
MAFQILVASTLLLWPTRSEEPPCAHGQRYAKKGNPDMTNVADSYECRKACGRSPDCKFFMYDQGTMDCWLLGEDSDFEDAPGTIAGPLSCDLDKTFSDYLELEESDKEKTKRITGIIQNLAKLVLDHDYRDELFHSMVTLATKFANLKSEDLASVDYNEVMEIDTVAIEWLNHENGELSWYSASERNLVLTRTDLDWLLKLTTGQEVSPEDVERRNRTMKVGSDHACFGFCGDRGYAARSFGAGTPWTSAQVDYCYDIALAPSARTAVMCAINQIKGKVPGIRFVNVGYYGRGSCNSNPAIFVQSSAAGCFADIGMMSGVRSIFGNQQLNLQTPGCNDCGTATHEMLHAMGMAHEQSRPDRDRYVTIVWHNIQRGMSNQFSVMSGADTSQPYDIGSIMHYDSHAFSGNGQPTIVAKGSAYSAAARGFGNYARVRLGQRTSMSVADANQLKALYNCRPPSFTYCDPVSSGLSSVPLLLGGGAVAAAGVAGFFVLRSRQPEYSSTLQRAPAY